MKRASDQGRNVSPGASKTEKEQRRRIRNVYRPRERQDGIAVGDQADEWLKLNDPEYVDPAQLEELERTPQGVPPTPGSGSRKGERGRAPGGPPAPAGRSGPVSSAPLARQARPRLLPASLPRDDRARGPPLTPRLPRLLGADAVICTPDSVLDPNLTDVEWYVLAELQDFVGRLVGQRYVASQIGMDKDRLRAALRSLDAQLDYIETQACNERNEDGSRKEATRLLAIKKHAVAGSRGWIEIPRDVIEAYGRTQATPRHVRVHARQLLEQRKRRQRINPRNLPWIAPRFVVAGFGRDAGRSELRAITETYTKQRELGFLAKKQPANSQRLRVPDGTRRRVTHGATDAQVKLGRRLIDEVPNSSLGGGRAAAGRRAEHQPAAGHAQGRETEPDVPGSGARNPRPAHRRAEAGIRRRTCGDRHKQHRRGPKTPESRYAVWTKNTGIAVRVVQKTLVQYLVLRRCATGMESRGRSAASSRRAARGIAKLRKTAVTKNELGHPPDVASAKSAEASTPRIAH